MARGRRRLRRLPAAALLVPLALSACSGTPRDGQVTTVRRVDPPGDEVPDNLDQRGARQLFDEPPVDAAPDEIVRQFLNAQVDATNSHEVARRYLAGSTTWDDSDRAGVTVYEGDRTISTLPETDGRTTVTVLVARVAVVTGGSYNPTPTPAYPVQLGLTKVQGQWRISSLPAGLLLSEASFAAGYARAVRYFPDPQRRLMVPDPMFVATANLTAQPVVVSLLSGPGPAISGAVRTAIPVNTRVLGVETTGDGVVTVNLSREVSGAATDSERAALIAQLVYTLTGPEVGATGVRLEVEGQPMRLPHGDSAKPQTRADWAEYDADVPATDARLFYLRSSRLVGWAGGREGVVRDAAGMTSIAVDRSGTALAAVRRTAGGEEVVVGSLTGELRSRITGSAFTAPSWGPTGAWTVRTVAGRQSVVVVAPGENARPAAVRGALPGEEVLSLQLSPDSSRVAMVVRRGTRTDLFIARVVPSGDALTLTGATSVAPSIGTVTTVAWIGAGRLVFTEARGKAVSVHRVEVDGFGLVDASSAEDLPAAPDTLVAAPGRDLVAEVNGRVLRAESGGWRDLAVGTAPTYAR